jgi:hypothetical protein
MNSGTSIPEKITGGKKKISGVAKDYITKGLKEREGTK